MTLLNSTNLRQFEGGAVVKQGDSASLFGYELLDENMRPISELNGKNATIRIFNQKGKATFESKVDKSRVTLKIEKALPIGSYLVEVVCSGYIFPSDRSTRLDVTRSADEFTSEEVLSLVKNDVKTEIDKYIAEHPNGSQTEELPDLTVLYNADRIANGAGSADQAIVSKMTELGQKFTNLENTDFVQIYTSAKNTL